MPAPLRRSKWTYILLLQYNLSKVFSQDLERLLQLIEIPRSVPFIIAELWSGMLSADDQSKMERALLELHGAAG